MGESIDAIVAHDKEGKALAVIRAIGRQPVTERLQVIDDLDVIDHLATGRNVAQDFFPNALLICGVITVCADSPRSGRSSARAAGTQSNIQNR